MESIHKQAHIRSHLNFVEGMINKHGWTHAKHAELMQLLCILKDRERDKSIYLAVVGEFGSGKSTLLNAILGKNILKSENIQGTTSVATYIRYGASVDVEVTYKNPDLNKKSVVESFLKTISRIISRLNPQRNNREIASMQYINKVTTGDDLTEKIVEVTLYYPSLFLKRGVVLIDTPGGNVKNENHNRITAEIINNKADAAIIVVPSDVPLSNTLINFIKDKLLDSLHRCIFVATKTDLIQREKDRKKLFNFIKARLDNEFGIDQSHVVELSPLTILDQYDNLSEGITFDKENKESLLIQSKQSLDSIIRISILQKNILYNERLLRLFLKIFESIESKIKQMDEGITKEIASLKSNPLTELNIFLNMQNQTRSTAMSSFIGEKRRELDKLILQNKEYAIIKMRIDIRSSYNTEELRNNVALMPGSISIYTQEIENTVKSIQSEIYQFTQKQLEELQVEFDKYYSILSKHRQCNLVSSTKKFPSQQVLGTETVNETVDGLKWKFKNEDNMDIALTSGGTGVGVFIGSIILPGIGTLIGGILGGIIGWLLGSSLDKQKSRCETELEEGIHKSFDQIQTFLNNGMKGFEARLLVKFSEGTADYLRYNDKITQMIKDYKNAIKEAEHYKNNMKQELIELVERRRIIENDLRELKAHI